ncbi:DUF4193 family protein [Pseudarthrobacter niigatensis]|uniref:Uncharacterized protein n=1 Tax=Pseudarthrobacter niigatensis TaxID=369935 RepID=A0AAJ1SPK6_9MICC|nr:DUF4193 family protein [Pseudarthrobacter niigatensis]MDQ0144716.1 hypothetical protein [Pseudarthrobacter niigatensis]MDQ0265362.1 hypothetical protein [Pseudarthrobacter niigatensis]
MELVDTDGLERLDVQGREFIAEELIVEVIPQAENEFTCWPWLLVRCRSPIALQKDGHAYCTDREG